MNRTESLAISALIVALFALVIVGLFRLSAVENERERRICAVMGRPFKTWGLEWIAVRRAFSGGLECQNISGKVEVFSLSAIENLLEAKP